MDDEQRAMLPTESLSNNRSLTAYNVKNEKRRKLLRIARYALVIIGGISSTLAVSHFGGPAALYVPISVGCIVLLLGPRRTFALIQCIFVAIWWGCVHLHHRIKISLVRPKFTYVDYKSKTTRLVSTLPPRPTVPHRRIICVSDTHTLQNKLTIPEGDILVHCGDILFRKEDKEIHKIQNLFMEHSPPALLKSFNVWLGEQPVKARVVIAGNHDLFCYESGAKKISEILSNAVYLENSSAVVEGLRFFGIPISQHGNKIYNAWQYPDAELRTIIESIAEKSSDVPTVDILLTHSKPYGPLENFVAKKKPKFIVSGHHHHKYGASFSENSVFINCASLNSLYMPLHPPVVFDYIL